MVTSWVFLIFVVVINSLFWSLIDDCGIDTALLVFTMWYSQTLTNPKAMVFALQRTNDRFFISRLSIMRTLNLVVLVLMESSHE